MKFVRTLGKRCFSSQKNERKSFGSFHSEDIETLIRIPSDDLPLPAIYQEINALAQSTIPNSWSFGHDSRDKLFLLDKKWTFINHGAFGGTLKPILETAHMWRNYVESQPLRFFDRDLFSLQCNAIHSIAHLVKSSSSNLLPIANVTQGLNVIFQTLKTQPPSKEKEILCLSLTYGSTKKIIQDFIACTKDSHQYRMKIIPVSLPISSEQSVCAEILKHINDNTKLIILDHITSNTAIKLPIHVIGRACKQINPNMLVVVDAAHSLFSQSIQLQPAHELTTTLTTNESNNSHHKAEQQQQSDNVEDDRALSPFVDFWLTNGHKWLSSCKGSAVMWISPRIPHLRPTIVSHGYQSGSDEVSHQFIHPDKKLSAFAWDGCRDYVPFLCFPIIINLWTSLASTVVPPQALSSSSHRVDAWEIFREYSRTLLNEAEELLQQEWQLSPQDFVCPLAMREYSPMRLIPLPSSMLFPHYPPDYLFSDKEAFQLQELLHHHYHIEAPVKCIEQKLYVRISAHVYNTIDDYKQLAWAIKQIGTKQF